MNVTDEQAEALVKAVGSSLWVFNNLHAVDDPGMREQFKRFARAAEADCHAAYDMVNVKA